MTASTRCLYRSKAALAALCLLAGLCCLSARGDDKKDEKPVKEKKVKVERWVEIRTAHFLVAGDGGEKAVRRIADEFESVVRVFQATMPRAQIGTGIPVRILAARDGQSFARVFPEFPMDKRHDQPPGQMASGTEKTYIGVRANAGGHFPYADIFQEYAREILKRSYRNLPPWLEEGYSTVYGNITFTDKGLRLDRPNPEDLSVLFESPLLPLDLVMHADRNSPYYSPGDKQSVYFAESRSLVHFLISDPQILASHSMDRYVTEVMGGTDSLQAARDAFGDLNRLQAKFAAFVNLMNGVPVEIPVQAGNDSPGPSRTLSASEIETRIADYQALRGRSEDAQDNLDDALMKEPNLAEAEQCLAFLMLKKSNFDEAQKHFEHAAQLDPKDALNFYGQGLVAMQRAGNSNFPASAAEGFEKAADLNPDFAPSWYNLALIYSQRKETMQKAVSDAKRAASLAPGLSNYQLQVASLTILASSPDTNTAPKTSVRVPPPPPSERAAEKASAPASSVPATAAKASADSVSASERKSAPAPAASVSSAAQPAPLAAPVAPLFTESTKVYSMIGKIADVNCGSAPQVQVTLKAQNIVMKLHADDLAQVSIKSAGASGTTKGATCSSLRGRSARITYLFVSGKPWDAEMQTVEFRNEP